MYNAYIYQLYCLVIKNLISPLCSQTMMWLKERNENMSEKEISEKMQEIMNRMKNRREELNMSYQTLSEKVGISKSTLQRYETGSIKNMPVDKLEEIAKYGRSRTAIGKQEKTIKALEADRKEINEQIQREFASFEDAVNNDDTELAKNISKQLIYLIEKRNIKCKMTKNSKIFKVI